MPRSPGRARRPTISPASPPRRSGIVVVGPLGECLDVPGLADVGQERAGHDAVRPRTVGPNMCGERHGERVEAGLGRAVGHLARRRLQRRGAADVDDAPTVVVGHVLGRECCESERSLEVDGDHLVEEVLRHRSERGVEGRHPGVVDEHVDPTEPFDRGRDQGVTVAPAADVASDAERRRRRGPR